MAAAGPAVRPRAKLVRLLVLAGLGVLAALALDRGIATMGDGDGGIPPERIVLVVIDTLRRDAVGVYGGRSRTPHIDGLATRGEALPDVYSAFHQTTFSMGALFTGRTPSRETPDPAEPLPWTGRNWCGLRRFAAPGERLCVPRSLPTLAEELRSAGYETLGVASNHFLFDPAGYSRGFDRWHQVGDLGRYRLTVEERRARVEARSGPHVMATVRAALDRRGSDRFFLYVHLMDVHDYALRRMSYGRAVELADDAVGELLGALQERGLREGSVVVVTSDHGERFAERHPIEGRPSHFGNPSFEYLIQVPLIVSPARLPPAHGPIRTEQVHERLRALGGAPASPRGDLEPGEHFLSETDWQTYRRGRWKSMHDRRSERRLLFDLSEDPQEQHDVGPSHPEILEQHAERIRTLTRALVTQPAAPEALTSEDRSRLHALGYLDAPDEEPSPRP